MKRIVVVSLLVFITIVLVVGLAWLGADQADRVATVPDQPGNEPVSRPAPPEEVDAPLTPADVALHDTRADCWIIVRGRVYDVTYYIDEHPAPPETIVDTCGTDATFEFETKGKGRPHSPLAWDLLERFYVDELAR